MAAAANAKERSARIAQLHRVYDILCSIIGVHALFKMRLTATPTIFFNWIPYPHRSIDIEYCAELPVHNYLATKLNIKVIIKKKKSKKMPNVTNVLVDT